MIKSVKVLKITNIIAFLIMIAINTFANIIPLNGITTGEVSDLYPNLFTPAGLTFSIWGLIYVMLFAYLIYTSTHKGEADLIIVNVLFPITCILNSVWLFAWHYQWVITSLVVIVLLFIILFIIQIKIRKRQIVNTFFVKIPFSIYLGWISVATIANTIILLVDKGIWQELLKENIMTIIMMTIAFILALLFLNIQKNFAYVAVIIWAFIGILIKHIDYYNNQYIEIMITSIVFMTLILVNVVYVALKKNKKEVKQ